MQPDSVLPDKPEYRFLKDTSTLRKMREAWDAKLALEPESDLARIAYDEAIPTSKRRSTPTRSTFTSPSRNCVALSPWVC